jgi:hypothetical protein
VNCVCFIIFIVRGRKPYRDVDRPMAKLAKLKHSPCHEVSGTAS